MSVDSLTRPLNSTTVQKTTIKKCVKAISYHQKCKCHSASTYIHLYSKKLVATHTWLLSTTLVDWKSNNKIRQRNRGKKQAKKRQIWKAVKRAQNKLIPKGLPIDQAYLHPEWQQLRGQSSGWITNKSNIEPRILPLSPGGQEADIQFGI